MAWARDLPLSFGDAVKAAIDILSANGDLVARAATATEAELIVVAAYRQALGQGSALSRTELHARLGDRYPAAAGEVLFRMAGSRAQGQILQHLTGKQVFLDHEYDVGGDVLVPRPETEVLVSHAIAVLGARGGSPRRGIEIGLGSGVISVELLARFPLLEMTASEISAEARERAAGNARRILGVEDSRLKIVAAAASEVWAPFGVGDVDFVISNPPYLLTGEADSEVRKHEPAAALFAPEGDPLFFYREIATGAAARLVAGGKVFVEIPHERAKAIQAEFGWSGWVTEVHADLTGRPRVLVASREGVALDG